MRNNIFGEPWKKTCCEDFSEAFEMRERKERKFGTYWS